MYSGPEVYSLIIHNSTCTSTILTNQSRSLTYTRLTTSISGENLVKKFSSVDECVTVTCVDGGYSTVCYHEITALISTVTRNARV